MNKIVTIFIISIFCIVSYGQGIDSLRLSRDSIPQSSVSSDSLVLKGTALYLVSKDSIQDPVDYGASDSITPIKSFIFMAMPISSTRRWRLMQLILK